MTLPPRQFRFAVESADPIYTGEAFCPNCGLAYTVLLTTDEPSPFDQGVRVICRCGGDAPVLVEDRPPGLDDD